MMQPKNVPRTLTPAPPANQAGVLRAAVSAHQQGDLAKAEALSQEILTNDPKQPDALHLLGVIAYQSGRHVDAIELIASAIAVDPVQALYYYNQGIALQALGREDEALASYEQVVRLQPDFAEAFNNRGVVLHALMRQEEALACYAEAIRLKPNYVGAFYNRGIALQALNRPDEALASFDAAIQLKPDHAGAFQNRGNTLQALKRIDEALESFEEALRLKPDFVFLQGTVLLTRSLLCQWRDFEASLTKIAQGVAEWRNVTPAFSLLALADEPALHRKAAEIWIKEKVHSSGRLGALPRKFRAQKIHVAYLSADFREHPVSYLTAQMLELHDRNRFELTAISFGPDKGDPMHQRVAAAFDRFENVRKKSDIEAARYCRELGVDIAVDLNGLTGDARPGILAERCAPVQINWLGYLGTMGAPFIDYIVADRTLITKEDLENYAEKVIWMPESFQVNDGTRAISPKVYARAECGLPEAGAVFCCFNTNYKILPATFEVWMRILKRVPGSVLWLVEGNPTVTRNLRAEAAARGVEAGRLVFAKRLPINEYLARYRVADLFLDTWPYNAGATASDALWAGLPVLTRSGHSFASRMAASLLKAIGLPELITQSDQDYEELAVALALDPIRLEGLKTKLSANRLTYPLFNCERFTRHLETGYQQVMERYWRGEEPTHLEIQPGGEFVFNSITV